MAAITFSIRRSLIIVIIMSNYLEDGLTPKTFGFLTIFLRISSRVLIGSRL